MIGLAFLTPNFHLITNESSFSFVQGAQTPAVAATPGVHLAQTPAYIAATPGVSQTPIGVWSAATNAATPGGALLPADHRSADEDGKCIGLSVGL